MDNLPDKSRVDISIGSADIGFVKTLGLTIIQGSDSTGSTISDSAVPVMVNETLVRRLDWEHPLGQEAPGTNGGRVVGVVNDFHVQPLAKSVDPLIIPHTAPGMWANRLHHVCIRLAPGNPMEVIDQVRSVYTRVAAGQPFVCQFVDEHLDARYRAEHRWHQIDGYTAILAIAVACFGAFGLTAAAVARRQKEIGVRKVLGATAGQIVKLLNREFIGLVRLGNLLAWPAVYFAVTLWLRSFAHHLNPWVGRSCGRQY